MHIGIIIRMYIPVYMDREVCACMYIKCTVYIWFDPFLTVSVLGVHIYM